MSSPYQNPTDPGPAARERDLLACTRELAREVLGPNAQAADQSDRPPAESIRVLARAGVLGATVPPEYGGSGLSPRGVRELLEIVAGGCGVTAFVLFQHLVGCRHVAGSVNETLRSRLLPQWATGERFCSLAFSHLRRPGPPAVRVEPEGEGYVFSGTAPWCTGWGLADDVLLAGTLPGGSSAWVVAPVPDPCIRASAPMRLCAANASATVSLECRGLRLGPETGVKTVTAEQLGADTAGAILFFSSLSLGVADAGIGLVRSIGEARGRTACLKAAAALQRELEEARAAVNACAARPEAPDYAPECSRLRAWTVDLGVRAAHAAVTAASGSANSLDHPAQRLFREALLYTLTAQTPDLQEATLGRLVR